MEGSAFAHTSSWWYSRGPVIFFSHIPGGTPPPLPRGRDLLLPGGSIVVEEESWPLLAVRFGAGITGASLEAYLNVRTEWLERCEPHVTLIDARELPILATSFRQRYIDWLREHEDAVRKWTVGSAYVIGSPEGHMLVSLIRHGAAMHTPYVVAPTKPVAAEWAAQCLMERGLPDAAQWMRARYALPAS